MKMKLKPKQYSLQAAFGPQFPADQTIAGYERSECPFIPEADVEWEWDRATLRDLVMWWMEGGTDPIYVFGHTGAGKSAGLRNFCAALQIPFYERTIYEGLEFVEVLTTTDLIDGTTVTSYGLLPLAMGVEGYPGVFNADDVDRADPGFLSGFYEVLQGQPVTTNVGGVDIVKPQTGFRIAATGNTALMGDRLGVYTGAKQQDIAFQDRFWKVEANYLPEAVEKQLVNKVVPQLDRRITDLMVDAANELRSAFMGMSEATNALPFPMSTRSLLRWAHMTYLYRDAEQQGISPVFYALDRAFLNAANGDPDVRLAIVTLVEGKLGPNPGGSKGG
jgi:cobaltochelatase CobS